MHIMKNKNYYIINTSIPRLGNKYYVVRLEESELDKGINKNTQAISWHKDIHSAIEQTLPLCKDELIIVHPKIIKKPL